MEIKEIKARIKGIDEVLTVSEIYFDTRKIVFKELPCTYYSFDELIWIETITQKTKRDTHE